MLWECFSHTKPFQPARLLSENKLLLSNSYCKLWSPPPPPDQVNPVTNNLKLSDHKAFIFSSSVQGTVLTSPPFFFTLLSPWLYKNLTATPDRKLVNRRREKVSGWLSVSSRGQTLACTGHTRLMSTSLHVCASYLTSLQPYTLQATSLTKAMLPWVPHTGQHAYPSQDSKDAFDFLRANIAYTQMW